MQLLFDVSQPEGTQTLDLVDLVADVAVALGEALKDPVPLYRGLKRSFALLVAEIRNIELPGESISSSRFRQSLERIAESLNHALRSDYVQAKYQQMVERETKTGFHFPFFQSWATPSITNPQETLEKWNGFPYPDVGMLHELVGSQLREEIRIVDLLSDDRQLVERLKKSLKDWNKLTDQLYAGEIDNCDDNFVDNDHQEPFIKESAFCGETSIRHLARSLYHILHDNWPCRVEDHEHSGKLGHCVSAKFRLDPEWGSRDPDPTRDSFFVLLTGSNIVQECRVCLHTCTVTDEESTLVCLVDHEDSRVVCLHLVKDENNRLWGQTLGQPPETLQPDEEYIEKSLRNLLDIVKPTYAAKRVLGVILARSILHLLNSPWIPQSFSIDDISLFCRLDNDRPYPFFSKVFLSTDFKTEIELGDDLAELYSQPSFAKLRNRPFELAKGLLQECRLRFHESGLLRAVKFCTDRTSFLRFANTNVDSLFANQEFDLVKGAKWTWDEVKWLERAKFDDEGVCKIITKLGNNNEKVHQDNQVNEIESDAQLNAVIDSYLPSAVGRPSSTLSLRLPTGGESQERHGTVTRPPSVPASRDDFEVAIICALPLEANAVLSLFDHLWDDDPSFRGRDSNDPNFYTLGTIGSRNVVLAHPPGMGKAMSATVAACCAMSFKNVKLGLVVGVCGGIPIKTNREEILLGDVLMSKGVIQYDFGRQFSDGFRRKIDVEDLLGRPNARISSSLAKLQTQVHRNKFEEQITGVLSDTGGQELYPGENEDRLFPSGYPHRHQAAQDCSVCANCRRHTDAICDIARQSTCEDIGCDVTQLVQRRRRNQQNNPTVHIGLFASGDSVVKSAVHRDKIGEEAGVIAFEMEGAGAWDAIPCVIIKGVCDYADSHKNKLWQEYAAATAAACAKAFVHQW
ncbi:hypothetical protein BDW59DRAFT_175150 [Aspergillus cavernicola]|uniref:Nucleoside phosphorylase domain-containing protein n=1 Tax=Aspergillus cavernicola TaxID=176166 RepID=A0ABR4HST4_9EURO